MQLFRIVALLTEKIMYKVAVIGLGMGSRWALAVKELPNTQLVMVYDKYFEENANIPREWCTGPDVTVAREEDEIYRSDADIVIVASPDNFHREQCVKALHAGKHVICEKPLALSLEDCRQIIAAVKASGRQFMTGQVCRYAPGFRTAKALVDAGRIGRLVYLESEYAHDYEFAKGYREWRKDPAIQRQGFLGGGCHALDLTRWLAGDPTEVFCYMNHIFMPDWPTPDTGVAIAKFPNEVLGRIFVSIGVKRPYTMRTVIYGTEGTIVCDNTSDHIQFCEKTMREPTGTIAFADIPVAIANHNVTSELKDFVAALDADVPCATDVYQGTRTVAFADAAIRSAASGRPEPVDYNY